MLGGWSSSPPAVVPRSGRDPDPEHPQETPPENEKGRSEERPFTTCQRVNSDGTNVLCLITLRARGDLELDGLTLFE